MILYCVYGVEFHFKHCKELKILDSSYNRQSLCRLFLEKRIRYCMIGLIISADILFLGIVKPTIVKTILKSYSKCRIRYEMEVCICMSLNFWVPYQIKKSQSTDKAASYFSQNRDLLTDFLASLKAISSSSTPVLLHL